MVVPCYFNLLQASSYAKFSSALNKVVNNFPRFDKLRGKNITLPSQYGTIYKSKVDLPGFATAKIWSVVVYGVPSIDWTASIDISDSTEAINKYTEISKKISFSKLDCRSLTKKENSYNRDTEWSASSIYEENDQKKLRV